MALGVSPYLSSEHTPSPRVFAPHDRRSPYDHCLLPSARSSQSCSRPCAPSRKRHDVGSVAWELDLTDLTLEELMNIDVEVTSVSRESETLSKPSEAVQIKDTFGF